MHPKGNRHLVAHRATTVFAVAVVSLLTLVTACGSGGSPDAQSTATASTIDLVYPAIKPVEESLKETLGPAFTQRTGITVNLVKTGEYYTDVDQRIANDAAAGSPPDLAIVGLSNLRLYADSQSAVDLTDRIAADPDITSQIDPAVLSLAKFDERSFGMPYTTSSLILYINDDAFRRAGLDPRNPPTTYSGLKAATAAIVATGAAKNGITFNADADNWRLQNLFASGNATFMNEDESQLTLNSPGALSVLDYWKDLSADGQMILLKSGDNVDAFRRGEVGMIVHSSANLKSIADGTTFPVSTSVMPIPDNGVRNLPPAGSALTVLTQDPAEQNAAWAVIKELTGPQGSTIITRNSGYVPLNQVAIDDSALLGDLLAKDQRRTPAIQQSNNYIQWFQFPGTNAVEINDILAKEFEAMFLSGKTPQSAMNDATDRIEGLLP